MNFHLSRFVYMIYRQASLRSCSLLGRSGLQGSGHVDGRMPTDAPPLGVEYLHARAVLDNHPHTVRPVDTQESV